MAGLRAGYVLPLRYPRVPTRLGLALVEGSTDTRRVPSRSSGHGSVAGGGRCPGGQVRRLRGQALQRLPAVAERALSVRCPPVPLAGWAWRRGGRLRGVLSQGGHQARAVRLGHGECISGGGQSRPGEPRPGWRCDGSGPVPCHLRADAGGAVGPVRPALRSVVRRRRPASFRGRPRPGPDSPAPAARRGSLPGTGRHHPLDRQRAWPGPLPVLGDRDRV